ncbi:MAG: DUF2156 domain-containing protein [Thermodesulfobacteriota bacterium]
MIQEIVPDLPLWPDTCAVQIKLRKALHPLFQGLKDGISEFTFANIFLFRETHHYRITRLGGGDIMITGRDPDGDFFMLPFGLPAPGILKDLFSRFSFMKNAAEPEAAELEAMGYSAVEDRDNFDYLYSRSELAELPGRKFHKKKNLVNAFTGSYNYTGMPLLEEYRGDAMEVLEGWRRTSEAPGDYEAAREAIEKMWPLQLCGAIYYVDFRPAAFTLGEEIAGDRFAVHFEKGLKGYRGLMQFVNMSFAAILPEKYTFINREQDLGKAGLKNAKMSYRPVGFVKKYRVTEK